MAATPAPLTSVRAIRALSNAEASQKLPVAFEATVTYYRDYERTMFVQDGDVAIFVLVGSSTNDNFAPGDRVLVRGTTQTAFSAFVDADNITLLRHGPLPKSQPTDFDELISNRYDCKLVTVRGLIRTADWSRVSDARGNSFPMQVSFQLQVLLEGGYIEAFVDNSDAYSLQNMLDAEVEITGVAGGIFDGKYQMQGIGLHVASPAQIKILKRAGASPWSLPLTPMDGIMAGYHISDRTQRVRVHGTITYYQPGVSVVLQDGAKSIWVSTSTRDKLEIGDIADATGFPESHNGFLALARSEINDSHVHAIIPPLQTTHKELTTSRHIIDLVSVEGQVVMEARGATQDQYELTADGQLFSAVYRHPIGYVAPPTMKQVPLGSRVRVTGICITEDANPFNKDVSFDILMRSFDDVTTIAEPSLLNVTNLVVIALVLLLLATAAGAWGWTLKRKVREQTTAMAQRIEAEAAVERRAAKLEQRRSRILEDINTSRPLAEIIEQITGMVSFWLDGAPCWCEIADGDTLGVPVAQGGGMRLASEPIPSRTGESLGILVAALNGAALSDANATEALIMGARLAALAMETRRLYSDLTHRSEFDLLTDVRNRFSLDRQLEAQIVDARQKKSVFGIIYVDLDKFKLINDRYGHHIGDLYLQESVLRMKRQLRGGDMLARLGGDEFAALLTSIRGRADIDEIAHRLERCFDPPFNLEGYELRGAASIGTAFFPDDGYTKDTLLNAADASMYAIKNSRRAAEEISQRVSSPQAATTRR